METKTVDKSKKLSVLFTVSITKIYQRAVTKRYDKVNHGLKAIYRVRQLQLGTIVGTVSQDKTTCGVWALMHKHKKLRMFDSRTVDGIGDRKTVKNIDENFRRLPSKFNKLEQKLTKEEKKEPAVEEVVNVLVEETKRFVEIKPKPKRRTKKRTKPDEGGGRILTDADLA